MSTNRLKEVVVIDGCRTPFMRANTDFQNFMAYELGKMAIKGLLDKTGLPPEKVDSVVMGTVIQNVKTSNVARESALAAGIPNHVPCHTVTMACISANRAIADAYDQIALGHADVVIAGGTDSVSDFPIAFKKPMRKKLFKAQKLKSLGDYLGFATKLRPSDFAPEIPKIAEFTTGRTMGQDCDRMVDRFGVTRKEQDEFAVRSHQLAAQATENGHLTAEMVAAELPPKFTKVATDNGIRGDSTLKKAAKLKPAFTRPHGTLTAANSSFLTDGAAVVLLMSAEKAAELGLTPKAYVRDYVFTAQNPDDELLLGPAFATPKVLDKTGLQLEDIDVFEFHEAFAGQVLSNVKCLNSDEFSQKRLGRNGKVGEVPMDKLNTWGGSLSIGHPFGATGARLVTTAANRLIAEDGKYALIASCAAGAHGHGMVLERYK